MSSISSSVKHVDLASFVSFGEAMTDFRCEGNGQWRSRSGGSPWRVAVALSRLGQLSAFAGGVSADPFGQALWRASAEAHLDLRFIQQVPKSPLLVMTHGTDPLQQSVIGDDSADLQFRPHALPAGWRHALRWAHFGAISLTREPLAARLVALAESLKDEGVRLSYDPQYRISMDSRYDRTLERMCRLADVIKVSDDDLRGLFRSRDPHVGLAQIAAWNPRAIVMLALSDGSARLFHPQGDLIARAPSLAARADPGSEPGGEAEHDSEAGDAALAGLLFSLMRSPRQDAEEHLRWAVAASALCRSGAGVQGLSAGAVSALMDAVDIPQAPVAESAAVL